VITNNNQKQTKMSRPRDTEKKDVDKIVPKVNSYEMIYDIMNIPSEELQQYYESMRYKGFDRNKILDKLNDKIKDKKILGQLILLCALQGPIRAASTKMPCGYSPTDLGIPASGQQKTENLSCARITSSTADIAAYYLKTVDAPKRFPTHPLPAWLQFPSAGSIKMPENYRQMHIDFAAKFSKQIGGEFNEGIYGQMVANAYLDARLKLFD
jgi:hypothetical protein